MLIFNKGWNIEKDGPGQRLIFYLKGCNMRCLWCANPESLDKKPQLLFYPKRSKVSVDYVCPYHAVNGDTLNRDLCAECQAIDCVRKWRNRCFEFVGENISPEEVIQMALESREMFVEGGGVTFGGGEPTLQIDELLRTVELLKNENIHTAIETNASTDAFKQVLGVIDAVICDLKAVSADLHKKMTGLNNEIILSNLLLASETQKELYVRIPLIPGYNAVKDEMNKIAQFISEMQFKRLDALQMDLNVEILPMHHMGQPKYDALGIEYPMESVAVPDKNLASQFKDIIENKRT